MKDAAASNNGRKSSSPETDGSPSMTPEVRVISVLRNSLAGIHQEIEHGYVVDPERIRFLEDGLRDLEEKEADRKIKPRYVRQRTDDRNLPD